MHSQTKITILRARNYPTWSLPPPNTLVTVGFFMGRFLAEILGSAFTSLLGFCLLLANSK